MLLLESLSRVLIEVADVEDAVSELGKRRYKSKEKQALDILGAAAINIPRVMTVLVAKRG
jgi:hypothetical protein